MTYEAVLLAAILLAGTGLFVAVAGDARAQPQKAILQLYLVAIAGGYFVACWSAGRQTLPMRTWRLTLADRAGTPLAPRQALARYILACAGIACGGVGVLWAFVDPERLFLHDRLAGTRILSVARPTTSS